MMTQAGREEKKRNMLVSARIRRGDGLSICAQE